MSKQHEVDPRALGLSEELFTAMGLLRRRAARFNGGDVWSPWSLTGAQIELLKLIRRQPRTSVAEAASELGLAANTVSTLIRQLSGQGLLERVRDDTDRRVIRLELTPTARQGMGQWRDQRSALTASAIARLSRTDRTALTRAIPVLSQLAALLEQPEAD